MAPATPQQLAPAQRGGAPAAAGAAASPGAAKKQGAKARAEEFKAWAEAQMVAMTGSGDLTFVDFLFTLPSAGEVQEYCATYLGADERTAAFASEFLRRKRADPSLMSATGGVFTAA